MREKKHFQHPLLCWDIASQAPFRQRSWADLRELDGLKRKYRWDIDANRVAVYPFDALIVTDLFEKILWVSRGFESMTGHTPESALNRRPSFLQGKQTDIETKARIRNAITLFQPITSSLINYRKNGSAYICRIEIIPLLTEDKDVTHFLAIEKELKPVK